MNGGVLLNLNDNFFYDLLFFNSPEMTSVSRQICQYSKLFVGVAFVAGAMWEFFSKNQYKELLMRTVLSLIILASYEGFLIKSVETSFVVADRILKKNSKNNYLTQGYLKARQKLRKETSKREHEKVRARDGKVGLWDKFLVMAKVDFNDLVATIIWLLIYIAFFILKLLYTTMFYLLYVFLSLQALAFIFPVTANSLQGSLRTYLSLIITPLVATIILIILGNNAEYVSNTGKYTVSETLRGLIQLLLSGILLLFSPVFASTLLDGRGSVMAASKVTHVITSTIMDMGMRAIAQWFKKIPQKTLGAGFKGAGKVFKLGGSKLSPSTPKNRGKTAKAAMAKKGPEEQALEKRARKLIHSSRENKTNLKDFTRAEKLKAIEMARRNPRTNFIRRHIYHSILSELDEIQEGHEGNKKAQPRSIPSQKRKRIIRASSGPKKLKRGSPKTPPESQTAKPSKRRRPQVPSPKNKEKRR